MANYFQWHEIAVIVLRFSSVATTNGVFYNVDGNFSPESPRIVQMSPDSQSPLGWGLGMRLGNVYRPELFHLIVWKLYQAVAISHASLSAHHKVYKRFP